MNASIRRPTYLLWQLGLTIFLIHYGIHLGVSAEQLFTPQGYIPDPRANYSMAYLEWLPFFRGHFEWMTHSFTSWIPAVFGLLALGLLTPLHRSCAFLLWGILCLLLLRNNLIESAEWPLLGLILFVHGVFGLGTPLFSLSLWFSFFGFTVLIVADQFRDGSFIFSPGLLQILAASSLTKDWVKGFFEISTLWTAISTAVALLHMSSLFLVWRNGLRPWILGGLMVIQIGSIAMLKMETVNVGILIWLWLLVLLPSPVEALRSIRFALPRIVVGLGIMLLVLLRPFHLLGPNPTPGPGKFLSLSPLHYPLGNPFSHQGFERRVRVEIFSETHVQHLQNDSRLLNQFGDRIRERIFFFNFLGTIHRIPDELSRQILQRSFCSDGLLQQFLPSSMRALRIVISRRNRSGEDFRSETPCPQ